MLTAGLLAQPSQTEAQTLVDRLSTLLTGSGDGGSPALLPVFDPAAAAISRDTIVELIQTEIEAFPSVSSAGGFVYRLNRSLGVPERVNESFGPFLAQRIQPNGRGQLSFALAFRAASFDAVDGLALANGTLPVTAVRTAANGSEMSVDRVRLDVTARTVVPSLVYGVTEHCGIGAAAPIVTVSISGVRRSEGAGRAVVRSTESGRASGLGDVRLQLRCLVAGSAGLGVALGGDVRLPTGSARNLHGAGQPSVRAYGATSLEDGRLGMHLNAGLVAGGVSPEVFLNMAVTIAATRRITLVAESAVRLLRDLSPIMQAYEPATSLPGAESMRWVPDGGGLGTAFALAGVKWNVASSYLISSNVLVRLTDAGLRARVTPSIALDYAIGW